MFPHPTPTPKLPHDPTAARLPTPVLLLALLALATALRLYCLPQIGYGPDELWTAELAMGRGSLHLLLPRNILLTPPPIFDLRLAAPWWHVWTHMQCTHPPLYFVLLRLWMQLCGTGDGRERLLSALLSVAAVAILFDAVRLLSGTGPAAWAGLLMAISESQIVHGRATRNYALLMLTALSAADALLRIEKFGMTRRRWLALACFILATMLTHYFCIGAVAAMFMYGWLRTRGPNRWKVVAAFAVAAAVFAIVWGPFMWQQRHLFSLTDDATLFLNEPDPHHVLWTFQRLLLVPAQTLVGPVALDARGAGFAALAGAGAALFILPWTLLRRRPQLLLWCLWLIAVPAPVLLLDLARSTTHLFYMRYTLLAGPAVFALVPLISRALFHQRWLAHALPTAAAAAAAIALPLAYQPGSTLDPHAIERQFQPMLRPDSLFLFISTGTMEWAAGENYLAVSRYFHPLPCPVALLDRPADASLLAKAMDRPLVLVFTKVEDARLFLPGLPVKDVALCPGLGMMWTMGRPTPAPATPGGSPGR